MRIRVAVSLAAVAALLGPGGAAAAQAPTHAEFVKEANALCVQASDELRGLREPGTAEEAARFMRSLIRIVSKRRTATRALAAPASDRATVDAEMTNIAKELRYFRRAEAAAAAGDQDAYVAALRSARTADLRGSALARKLGLAQCV
jgi:hypothetical protein